MVWAPANNLCLVSINRVISLLHLVYGNLVAQYCTKWMLRAIHRDWHPLLLVIPAFLRHMSWALPPSQKLSLKRSKRMLLRPLPQRLAIAYFKRSNPIWCSCNWPRKFFPLDMNTTIHPMCLGVLDTIVILHNSLDCSAKMNGQWRIELLVRFNQEMHCSWSMLMTKLDLMYTVCLVLWLTPFLVPEMKRKADCYNKGVQMNVK